MQVLPLLKTGTQAWQPSDFLPDSSDPDFEDKVRHMHKHLVAAAPTAPTAARTDVAL